VKLRRLALVSLGAAVIALASGLPASAKEGVKATLTTPIPLGAREGTQLTVGWKLFYLEHGHRKPFGAGDIFVRLRSKSGGKPSEAFGTPGRSGHATVVVPQGGIGDIQIGLMGWSSGPGGTHRAAMFFPITNDPLPGPAHIVRAGSKATTWIWGIGAGVPALAVFGIAFVLLRRGRGELTPA